MNIRPKDDKSEDIWHLKCLKCKGEYSIRYADIMDMRVEPLTHTIYSYCNECRGKRILEIYPKFRLKKCPFCGDEMTYVHELYYNKNNKLVQYKYWEHEHDNDCILDEIMMPLHIGAGDADPERDYVGEYGEKWNEVE